MLKIVYPICCGIDVHKKFIVATIASTENNITTYKTKKFTTYTNDLLNFKKWLYDNNCYDICMESTGKYWIAVFNILKDSCSITLANPKYIKLYLVKKLTRKILSGLLICISMVL
ncbi:IS110 family transposase [Keratinibaculum paraultunense]|uniref:IS110 family transposase n=1 Tax=Keratinibaculum paraultunense TaxID=1278232 RepID=UPI00192B5BB1|nr:transposase [Keratinibaculum paraultunense]QQY79537.1 hypothetical protein JL105_10155 [Keratinibaculum paraultunense]